MEKLSWLTLAARTDPASDCKCSVSSAHVMCALDVQTNSFRQLTETGRERHVDSLACDLEVLLAAVARL